MHNKKEYYYSISPFDVVSGGPGISQFSLVASRPVQERIKAGGEQKKQKKYAGFG